MNDWTEKINAHADGELNEAEVADVQRMLDADPRAAAEHQWAVYIRQTLRTKHVTPDHSDAWSAALKRLDAIDALEGDPRVSGFVGRYGWSFAAVLFVVILFAGFMNRGAGPGAISSQELAGLFSTGPITLQQDVRGAVDADVFAQQNLGTNLPQVDPVVQVNRVGHGVHDGIEFLKVDMTDNSGALTMFVFRGVNDFDGLDPVAGRGDYVGGLVNGKSVVGWSKDGYAFMLICDRLTEELVSIADRMRR